MSDGGERLWTVGDVLNAMSGSGWASVPNHVLNIVSEVREWLAGSTTDEYRADMVDIATGAGSAPSDVEYLFNRLEWASGYVDLLPSSREIARKEEAVVLSVGPIVLDEGLRMTVDHAALFAAGACRRIWLISDTWVAADILAYLPHIKALRERGVELRFLLVTPWGCSEIPWNKE